MKDHRALIDKLRRDAADAARICDETTDEIKRDIFDRIARHLTRVANEIEQLIATGKAGP